MTTNQTKPLIKAKPVMSMLAVATEIPPAEGNIVMTAYLRLFAGQPM